MELLKGAYDLHIHTSPDVVPRKCTDVELGHRLLEAGMAGCAIKNHYTDTSARAAVLNELFPSLNIAGGVVLNHSVGGINPAAVERSAQMGGRLAWFPTLEAKAYQEFRHKNEPGFDSSRFISVLDDNGKLIPPAVEVLETAAKYKICVGTGHLSAREGLALAAEAARLGCQLVLTHADNPADQYSTEQQKEAVRLGALVEHSFFTTFYERTSIQKIVSQIRAVGCENVLLTTDFGQPGSPYPDEGLSLYAKLLLENGITLAELDIMLRKVPARMLAGNA